MKELIMCMLPLLVQLYLFTALGMLVLKVLHQRFRLTLALVLGFFAYYALFQILYLPCMVWKIRLSVLGTVWLAFCLVMGIFSPVFCRDLWGKAFLAACRRKRRRKGEILLAGAVLCLIGFQIYYMVRYGYNGYDTQYYIGAVNTSVYTDTMFVYNAVTGMKEQELPLRYALSGFYMNAAVFCRFFHAMPVLYMRYVTGILCSLLANSILYEIGRLFFEKNRVRGGCWMVIWGVGLNFLFRSMYTTSEFLMLRSYEAKAFCANVVLPGIFLACMWIWKKADHRKWWVYLGLMTFSADTISMSAIVTAPAMVGALLLGKVLASKGSRRIGSALLCLLPCILYLGAYLLTMKGILRVSV